MIRLDQPRRKTGESVVPMINVAFLLLIFFLMVAVIAPPYPVAVTLPQGETERDVRDDASMIVTVSADAVMLDNDGMPLDLRRIEGQSVVLRADAAVEAHQIARLMSDLSAAGAVSLQLAVSPD